MILRIMSQQWITEVTITVCHLWELTHGTIKAKPVVPYAVYLPQVKYASIVISFIDNLFACEPSNFIPNFSLQFALQISLSTWLSVNPQWKSVAWLCTYQPQNIFHVKSGFRYGIFPLHFETATRPSTTLKNEARTSFKILINVALFHFPNNRKSK